jgi:holin-like protein
MPGIVRAGIRRALIVAAQIASLWGLSWAAQAIAALSPLPLPAGAVGLAVLFALLCAGVVRAQWIETGADLLVRHLGLFLIPYAVSFMAFGELIAARGFAILGVVVASTAIGIAASGWAAQSVARASGRRESLLRSTL